MEELVCLKNTSRVLRKGMKTDKIVIIKMKTPGGGH